MQSFDNIDKLPHSATAKSMTEENMSAASLNVPEAGIDKIINIKFLYTTIKLPQNYHLVLSLISFRVGKHSLISTVLRRFSVA